MANKNFIVKNGLEVGGQEVVSSSGVVTSAALGGQTLASTDSPTFNNLTLTNDIAVGGDLNLTGDLNITGDVNSLSVTDLDVTDQTITLGAGQVESASGGSGIVVDGSNASLLWNETSNRFDLSNDLKVGAEDGGQFSIEISGGATGTAEGGELRLNTAADYDGTYNHYRIDVYQDDFRIGRAGTTDITLNSSGNVGIGTTAPTSFLSNATSLEISGGTGVGSELILTNDSSMSADEVVGSLIFKNTDGSGNPNHFAGLRSKAEAQYGRMYLEFYAGRSRMEGGTPDMVISPAGADAQGRVGIGTTSPNANLHIGSASATGDATNPALQIGGATTYRLGMYTDSEAAYIHNANGDNGIRFHVKTLGEVARLVGGNGALGVRGAPPSDANSSYPLIAVGTSTFMQGLNDSNESFFGNNSYWASDGSWHRASVGKPAQIAFADGETLFRTSSSAGSGSDITWVESARFTNNGNLKFVGQTTNFESPGFTYHTNNYLYLRGGSAGLILADDSNANTIQIIDGASGYLRFETGDGSERMRINSSRIEIDPTNDLYKFTYNGSSFNEGLRMASHTNGYSVLVLGAGTGDSGSVDGQWTIARHPDSATSEDNKFSIRHQSDALAFNILKDGNVGIGVDAPSQKLEVGGIIKLGGMMLQNTTGGGSIGFNRNPANGADISGLSLRRFQINGPGTTSGDYLEFQSYNSSGTSVGNIRIQDGNLGIGTTPTYLTDLYGSIGDQSPLLRGTAHNTSTSNFNWISEFLMPNLSGGHRVVHAIGTARSNGNAATIGFYEHATDSSYNAFNVGIFGNNDILNVCYNNRVGIATQTPSSTLTVNGQIESLKDSYNEGGQLILRAPSSVSSSKRFNIDTFALSGASTMRFFSEDDSNGANGAVHMYIKANGFVGINTAPNYQLDVRGQNSGTNGHMAYIENNGGGGNGCTFSVQHTDGNHSWGVVQELRIQSGSGTDNPSILFSSGTESTNTWTVGYGYTDNNFRIKRDHGYHNGGWGTSLFTMDRSGNVTIGGSLTQNSDERLKENITTIPNALNKVSQLRGVTFDWKERDDEGNVRSSMGLIAQEVEAIEGLEVLITEVANDGSPEMEEFQPKGVIYQNMVGLLVESIKELKTELDAAKARITELER